mmetsp:Transcript_7904/g.15319  ORF Transcript_7904/g.15319 Transcript_7904/m.15319 type:complete len:301 (-) Transcript_7904:9231-10133(-)
MGGCVCSERSAYFEKMSTSEYRTDMLIKYLKPRAKLTIKHQTNSGDEGDEESGTEGSYSEEEQEEKPSKRMSKILESDEEETYNKPPPKSNLFFPLSPPPKNESQEAYFPDESPAVTKQPPLTRMSEEPEDFWAREHEVAIVDEEMKAPSRREKSQSFAGKPEVIIVSQQFLNLKAKRKIIVRPEVHTEVIKLEPVIEETIFKTQPPIVQSQEAYSPEPVFQEFEDIVNREQDSFDPMEEFRARESHRLHYLRTPAPILSPDLYERNLRGSLTREEEWDSSPYVRNSVTYSPVKLPEELE